MKLTLRLVTLALAALVVGAGAQASLKHGPRLNLAANPPGAGIVSTSDGRVSCEQCRTPYRRGTVLTLRAKPGLHYQFDRWFGDCIGVAPICTVALDRDTFARAQFVGEPTQVDLSVGGPGKVTSDPPGIDCGGGHNLCTLYVPYNSLVALTPAPDSSGRFAGWDGPCAAAGTGTCYLNAPWPPTATAAAFGHASPTPGPQSLTVTRMAPWIRVTSTPAGIDCPLVCTASFASGTLVTLYNSEGLWLPACAGYLLERCAIVVDAPTEVGLAPVPPPPPAPPPPPRAELRMTVSRGGNGLVTSSDGLIRCGWAPKPQFGCSETLSFGPSGKTVLRLTTRAGARARFARWGGACRGTKRTCNVSVRWSGEDPDLHPVTGLFRRRSGR